MTVTQLIGLIGMLFFYFASIFGTVLAFEYLNPGWSAAIFILCAILMIISMVLFFYGDKCKNH